MSTDDGAAAPGAGPAGEAGAGAPGQAAARGGVPGQAAAATGGQPAPPWLRWQVGERVVVRYRAADGVHDALGDLLAVTPDGVVVRTRRGDVPVPGAAMVIGKRVPPPPRRRTGGVRRK
ncbi:2-hydroxymuconic semialdehyde dehydrogenase [Georgenia sp. TF02-10]|uniref:putative acetyltransferase n=1 Tax=Georgenia sp. TF02-10 TaxID=2917725 RepID=UPI001FA77E52|nr:2-hydroxymuconic semialdehyde dehydrogenase [Georgenia sp. TF02-10]UNX55673.1 2-hydroxymuconic semialdehyde dehydrogenase [Georgenia sp. TF02-10]